MPFNLTEFRAALNKEKGLARPAYFRVMFSGKLFRARKIEALALLCNQASIPGRAISANPVRTYGPRRLNPNLTTYDDIGMTFYCQNDDLFPRPLFEEWQNAVIEATTGIINYPDNYVADVEIEQYDETGKITYAIRLIDAFPIIVAPMALDWGARDTIHNLNVSFSYRKMYEQPLPLVPFGNHLIISNLYPNLDLGGAIDEFGMAIIGKGGKQVITRWTRGNVFGNAVRNLF